MTPCLTFSAYATLSFLVSITCHILFPLEANYTPSFLCASQATNCINLLPYLLSFFIIIATSSISVIYSHLLSYQMKSTIINHLLACVRHLPLTSVKFFILLPITIPLYNSPNVLGKIGF